MVNDTRPVLQPAAWDPRSPARLLLLPYKHPLDNPDEPVPVSTLLSHDGVGCNAFEVAALVDLLDAHDAYVESKRSSSRLELWQHMRSLSTAYRKALFDCVSAWHKKLEESEDRDHPMGEDGGADGENDPEISRENLDLLVLVRAITDLSETFLLMPANSQAEHFDDAFAVPGALTASTVRYLRLHHMEDVYESFDPENVHRVLNSSDPERYEGGAIYWKLIEKLAIRGRLEDVWGMLSRHSSCRVCFDDQYEELDGYSSSIIEEDREGFKALNAILTTAPLPAGRNETFDAGFQGEEEEEEEEWPESFGDEVLENPIPLDAYEMWENGTASGSISDFNPLPAEQYHKSWRQQIGSLPTIRALARRIPRLSTLVSILTGRHDQIMFDTWAEELCAELLYKKPLLRPKDIHVRASQAMKHHGYISKGGFEEQIMLSIMKGNGLRVIQAIHNLGGGSGAALPALMTSLLCNLLIDAEAVPFSIASSHYPADLLINAAFAIESSLASRSDHGLAASLAARALLPHITPKGDVRLSATLGEMLERHAPESDEGAEELLSLCRGLIKRKNMHVFEGCISMIISRYRFYERDNRLGGAVHWLLIGLEIESLLFRDDSKRASSWQRELSCGSCFRLLTSSFDEVSGQLVKGLLGDLEGVSMTFPRAQAMANAAKESEFASYIPSVKVLALMVDAADAIVERTDNSIIATNIVACLEQRRNEDDDGVVSCLARGFLHLDLLRLACLVLEQEAAQEKKSSNNRSSSLFDVQGMQVLLERFTVLISSKAINGLDRLSDDDIKKMRLVLGEGLMRAFVSENAKKRSEKNERSVSYLSEICAADLGKHRVEDQEKVVQMMLDF